MMLDPVGDTDLAPLGVLDQAEAKELVLDVTGRVELAGERMVGTSAERATAWVAFTRHRITCPGGVDPVLCGCESEPDQLHAYLAEPGTDGALPVRPDQPPGPQRCKDCPPNGRRPAPYPGPRCDTHHRAYQAAAKRNNYGSHIRALFSVTIDEYDEIKAAQGGVCAICGISTGARKRLHIDHGHETRLIRGLLCFHCNKYLGWVRDNPEVFRRGMEYLTNPPAQQVLGERRTDDIYRQPRGDNDGTAGVS
jgi:hypothetical protein